MMTKYFVCSYDMIHKKELFRTHWTTLEEADRQYEDIKKNLEESIKSINVGRLVDIYLVDYATGDIIKKDRFQR